MVIGVNVHVGSCEIGRGTRLTVNKNAKKDVLLCQKHGGSIPWLVSDVKVYLSQLHNSVNGTLLTTTPTHHQATVHSREIKRDHANNGQPEKKNIACLPRLVHVETKTSKLHSLDYASWDKQVYTTDHLHSISMATWQPNHHVTWVLTNR